MLQPGGLASISPPIRQPSPFPRHRHLLKCTGIEGHFRKVKYQASYLGAILEQKAFRNPPPFSVPITHPAFTLLPFKQAYA
ncbi:hypothetical protein CEXT_503061 [Caerostris extrusa]|uniref:Uncharacterized protein n=1 Tax=Caerostris extrusa TaxID=172846 RepID=A0AAV4PEI5_CAEEX|nr:hypothetical protein CEXT_503061 [Caerostris extrusa]